MTRARKAQIYQTAITIAGLGLWAVALIHVARAYSLRDQSTKGTSVSPPPNSVHYPGPDFTQNIVSATLRLFP